MLKLGCADRSFFLSIFWWRPFSPFPFSWSVGGVGRPQVHACQPVSLATGRSTISPTLHLYTGPFYRVYDRLARKVIFTSKSPGPGIKLETHRADPGFFRAPYPLDQLSSPNWQIDFSLQAGSILGMFLLGPAIGLFRGRSFSAMKSAALRVLETVCH